MPSEVATAEPLWKLALALPSLKYALQLRELGYGDLDLAIAIAVDAHRGQTDKGGAPYILHALRVMEAVSHPQEKIVAVLHDIKEDAGWTLEMLRAAAFPEEIVLAIDAISRRPGETYDSFIERVAQNKVSRAVKLADLADNSDLSRIPHPSALDYQRLRKYQRASARLKQAGSAVG